MAQNRLPATRVALVTGSAGGIMRGICLSLARCGYAIAANYKPLRGQATETVELVRSEGGEIEAFPSDVSVPAQAAALVAAAHARFGRLDLLVCGAGPIVLKSAWETSLELFHDMLEGNLSSVFYCVKAVLPIMREQKRGRIIAFGMTGSESGAGQRGMAAYAAAKAGVVTLIKSISLEEARHGITCNVINPGYIRQKDVDRSAAAKLPDWSNPTTRSGSWEDIGDAVVYLASDKACFVNGAVLAVNGGWQGILKDQTRWS